MGSEILNATPGQGGRGPQMRDFSLLESGFEDKLAALTHTAPTAKYFLPG
jgi:hypothetical protein